ncbi:MAG: hypothetical protein K1X48_09750 [Burkholderiaceae bacterium]|nr:hypothetical protein [Burkholderiaceae bacterium]
MQRRQFFGFAFASTFLIAGLPNGLQAQDSPPKAVTVELRDYAPEFAAGFESLAGSEDASLRLKLWNQQTQAAAFLSTQTPQAELEAKIQASWPRYAQNLNILKAGFAALKPSPVEAMNRINRELRFKESLKLSFVAYAGLFDNRVFSTVEDGVGTLYLPLEAGGETIAPAIAREYAKIAIRQQMGSPANQPLAERIVREGLALRMARAALAELPEERFFQPGELAAFQAKRKQILAGVRPLLSDSSPETVNRFASGKGPATLPGEDIYAGYLIVGQWLSSKLDMDYIKKIPRNELAGSVARVIDVLQKK